MVMLLVSSEVGVDGAVDAHVSPAPTVSAVSPLAVVSGEVGADGAVNVHVSSSSMVSVVHTKYTCFIADFVVQDFKVDTEFEAVNLVPTTE